MFMSRRLAAAALSLLACSAAVGGPPDVTAERFQATVIARSKLRPVVVEYYADWCGFCRRQAPVFARLAGEYAGKIEFLRVNVDEEPDLASRYQIRGLPSVVVFDAGMPLSRLRGFSTAAEMREVFNSFVER